MCVYVKYVARCVQGFKCYGIHYTCSICPRFDLRILSNGGGNGGDIVVIDNTATGDRGWCTRPACTQKY